MVEVAPGIERIESVFGPRPFAQYLLRGEKSMLIDTGSRLHPWRCDRALFRERRVHARIADLRPDQSCRRRSLRWKRGAPTRLLRSAIFCASTLDIPIITNRERTMSERYGWYVEHGPNPPITTTNPKRCWPPGMGPDTAIDLALQRRRVVSTRTYPARANPHVARDIPRGILGCGSPKHARRL